MRDVIFLRHARTILRHVRSLPTPESRTAAMSMFREGMKQSDEEKVRQLRANAASYAELVSSVTELKILRGLDTGEKMGPRDTIQASAARVGLHVPSWADDALPEVLPPKPTNPHLVGP